MRFLIIFTLVFCSVTLSAYADKKPAWMIYKGYDKTGTPDEAEDNTDEAHISRNELLKWTHDHVVEALSYEPFSFEADVKSVRAFFTDNGWQAYKKYMVNADIPDLIQKKNYELTSTALADFAIREEKEIDGYRGWMMSAPFVLSFFDAYTQGDAKKLIATAHVEVQVIVKRVEKGVDRENIAFHDWFVKPQEKKEEKESAE
tara:strand:+ start:164 stop:769 length:606 start_codon:yes stop_codon:yes gene_type:complete